MKQAKLPLILLFVLVGLGGLAYWDDQETAREEKAEQTAKKLFPGITADEVSAVTVKLKDEEEIKLEKTSDWVVEQPVQALADSTLIETYLNTLLGISYEKALSEGVKDLSVYGLKEPSLKVSFDSGEKSYTLSFGSKTPIGMARYARLEGDDRLLVTGSHNFKALNRKLFEFRDKTLGFSELAETAQISLVRDEEILLERHDSEWKLVQNDDHFGVDQNFLDQFWSSLSGNKVVQFIDEPSAKLQEALKPANSATELVATLNWSTSGGESSSIQFLKHNEDVYAVNSSSNQTYRVQESLSDILLATTWDFRDKNVFDRDLSKLEKIQIDDDLYVKDQSSAWIKESEPEKALDHIRYLVNDIDFMQALNILDDQAALKSLKKVNSATLVFSDEPNRVTLDFYQNNDNQVFVSVEGKQEYFEVEKENLENFSAKNVATSTEAKPGADKG